MKPPQKTIFYLTLVNRHALTQITFHEATAPALSSFLRRLPIHSRKPLERSAKSGLND